MSQDDYAKRALSAGDEYANNLAYYRTTAATDFLAGVQWARSNPPPEVMALVEALERICKRNDLGELVESGLYVECAIALRRFEERE